MATQIKLCGITRPQDALAAVELGVQALGLNFAPRSSRYIDAATAVDIVQSAAAAHAQEAAEAPARRDAVTSLFSATGRPVCWVGVFVDAQPDYVREVDRQVGLDLLQFHGDEPGDYCRQFGRPYVKAIAMHSQGQDWPSIVEEYSDAHALLLDSASAGFGGSGETFNWDLWPKKLSVSLVLAGGLASDNVGEAIQHLSPQAVDASSGVEGEIKGVKSAARMAAFVQAVNHADATRG